MLAVAFAKTVTAKTTVGNGWIARKGEATLFRALREILPQVNEIDSLCPIIGYHFDFDSIFTGYSA
jgi:hypothetical protein